MRKMQCTCVVLVLALAAVAAMAQGAPAKPAAPAPAAPVPSMFNHVDANGDGVIIIEEEKVSRLEEFKIADKNGDGKLTLDEHTALLAIRQQAMDADKDGVVTKAEIVAWGVGEDYKAPAQGALKAPKPSDKGVFASMDQNGDGKLSREEIAAYATFRFEEKDTNKDGKATADEQKASAEKYFKAADINADGTLSVEEYILYWIGPSAPPTQAPAKPAPKAAK